MGRKKIKGTNLDDIIPSSSYDFSVIEKNNVIWGYGGNDVIEARGGNDKVYGGSGNDQIYGGSGKDRLYGGTGDDYLDGGTGNDKLYGGDGNDELHGGDGKDRLYGGIGDDKLYGENGNDRLYGEDGDDELYGGSGKDQLYGGAGNDIIDTGTGNDIVYAGDGNDTVIFYGGNNVIYGGDGNDILSVVPGGSLGNDTLYGGDGDDKLSGGIGDDTYYGGTGVDIMGLFIRSDGDLNGNDTVMDLEQHDWLRLKGNWSGLYGSEFKLSDVETILTVSQSGSDTILETSTINGINQTTIKNLTGMSSLQDIVDSGQTVVLEDGGIPENSRYVMYGGDGNDRLTGQNADDVIYGGAGDDYLRGGAGNDVIYAGIGDDVITDGDGDDLVIFTGGNNIVFGGAGNDDYRADPNSTGNDTIFAGDGDDQLRGGKGDDHYFGGSGVDLFGLYVNSNGDLNGNDTIYDLEQHDWLRLKGQWSAQFGEFFGLDDVEVVFNVQQSTTDLDDTVIQTNTVNGTFTATIKDMDIGATSLRDIVNSGQTVVLEDTVNQFENSRYVMFGGDGNDKFVGQNADDQFYAGHGDDIIKGGGGNDSLYGGTGNDIHEGGAGSDLFPIFMKSNGELNGNDTFVDFSAIEDRLLIHGHEDGLVDMDNDMDIDLDDLDLLFTVVEDDVADTVTISSSLSPVGSTVLYDFSDPIGDIDSMTALNSYLSNDIIIGG